jgi:hypothetical protein
MKGTRTVIDARGLIEDVHLTLKKHSAGRPGAYVRWRDPERGDAPGNAAYGAADAANILYTIGCFPREYSERKCWTQELQSFQDPDTGLYLGADHHPYHTTAFCIAALELFDAVPKQPVHALHELLSHKTLEAFLDALDWIGKPWSESHQGAGIYVSLVLTGVTSPEWEDWYFGWLSNESDPETGLWRRGCIREAQSAPLFHHLAGTFHYLFNFEYARRRLPYPERLIDTCIDIERQQLHSGLGESIGFAEIDWVYCLNRAMRQTGYRFEEARRILTDFAERYLQHLMRVDRANNPGWNDLHALFGAVCALAELQQALPGLIRTEKPLRLVLDRRPFI